MIKKFILLLFFSHSFHAFSQNTTGNSIYSYTVTDINTVHHPFVKFKGKKIWVVILPVTKDSASTVFLQRIDSLSQVQMDSTQFIVVPSYEDGYIKDSNNILLNWYQSTLHGSIISEPLYTHISSGYKQDSVFNWLTHSRLNLHFDNEVCGAGSIFCIDEQGSLISLFCTSKMWSVKALNKIFN